MQSIPAYERIREGLRMEFREAALGTKLPSETTLAKRYGVTRMTVRHAISFLASEGLVTREQGRGTFVAGLTRATRPLSALTSLSEDLRNQGLEPSTRVFAQEEIAATPQVARALALDIGAHVLHIARVRSVEERPVAIQHAWVPMGLCPTLAHESLENGSLYETLERRYGVRLRRAEQRISAVAATNEQTALLDVTKRSPLLHIERITVDDSGKRVEFALSWTRPEYELTAVLER